VGHIFGKLGPFLCCQSRLKHPKAEEQGFSEFHLYVCVAFLVKWSDKLRKMDFQEVMMFLQALPTRDWTEKDIELLLSEAFIWQSLFKGSSSHLKGGSSTTPSAIAAA
jgi:hypothetical protein